MSLHSDEEDEDLSQEENEQEMDGERPDDQQENIFLTDDPNTHLSTQPSDDEYVEPEPIEARPPNEVDIDEQERHQSGTPAFRTLEEVKETIEQFESQHFL